MYVSDVVKANLLAMDYNKENAFSIFNIGGGEIKTSYETTNIIREILNSKSNIVKSKKTSPMGFDIYLDCSKAKQKLGFQPKKMHENITLMVKEAQE